MSPAEESSDGSLSVPVLLPADEVAKLFNRSKRTVRNWIRAGYLRPVRVGRAVFFRADDIAELLNAGGPPKT